MIVDSHTHLNHCHEEKVLPRAESLHRLQACMEKNRVDCSWMLTPSKVSEHRAATRDVVAAARDPKNIFVVAGLSYLQYEERDLREPAFSRMLRSLEGRRTLRPRPLPRA